MYLLIQFFYYKITDNCLPIYISYDFLFPSEQRAENLLNYYKKWGFRPSSLFLEASYYAFFCMPFLCVSILKENKRTRDYIFLLLVIGAIFLARAGSGIIGIFILFSYFVLIKLKKLKIGIFSYLLLIIIIICSIFYFLSLDLEGTLLHRIQKGGSINYRVTRGILIFKSFPFIHKVFGIGINNIDSYMFKNEIVTPFDEANLNYMCSILQVLNYSGIIGIILLFNYMFKIWKKVQKNVKLKAIFFIIIFTMSYEYTLFSYRFAFLLIILIGNMNIVKKEKK